MTDVEKYGLFAVVTVGGLLLLVALQGGFGGDDDEQLGNEPAAAAATAKAGGPTALRPIVIDGRARRNGQQRRTTAGAAGQRKAPQGSRAHNGKPARAAKPPVAAGSQDGQPVVFRVRDPVPREPPFQFKEEPFPYPGEHSVPARALNTAPRKRVTHAVAMGETLSDISEAYFGTTTRWKEILALNPGVDPKRLKIGQELLIRGQSEPDAKAAAAQQKPGARKKSTTPTTYTVKVGDTLGRIARSLLGSVDRVDDLFAANRDVLASRDDLSVGQVLRIP